jgi:hypothetical protein
MGSEADEIFSSFQLSDDNEKKFNVVKEKFDGYFIPKRNNIFERAKFNKQRQNEGVGDLPHLLHLPLCCF